MRPLPLPKSQIFESLQTLPQTKPMSSHCTPTWASVVANGIQNGPAYPISLKLQKSQALPSDSPLRERRSKAKPSSSSAWPSMPSRSTSTSSPSPSSSAAVSDKCDILPSKSRKQKSKAKAKAKSKAKAKQLETSPLPSPLPLQSPSPSPPQQQQHQQQQQQSSRNEQTLDSGASVNSSPNDMYYYDNRYPRTQGGYRSYRHPHCPTPTPTVWRPRRVRSRTGFGSLFESDQRYIPQSQQQMDDKPTTTLWTDADDFAYGNRYWRSSNTSFNNGSNNNGSNSSSSCNGNKYRENWRSTNNGVYRSSYSGSYSPNWSSSYSSAYNSNNSSNYSSNFCHNYSPNFSPNFSPTYGSNYNSDSDHLHLQSSGWQSPREWSRCQVPFGQDAWNTKPWQMVGNSRQVWEPLLRNQRSQDPSNSMPPPPPGFEQFPLGKKLLSSRSRQLLGEQVSCWQQADYDAPQPMSQPEQELREQLHFIGKHDTHLTWRPSQLRVTNGGTGDGYYVRSVSNPLLHAIKKESVSPKPPATYPKISYWDLLCSNKETNDMAMETSPNININPDSESELNPFNSIDQNIDQEEFEEILNLTMPSN